MSPASWASSRSAKSSGSSFFLEVEFGLFQDLDASAVEIGEQIFEFAAGGEILGQQLIDFVVENETFFFAHFHEIVSAGRTCHLLPLVPPYPSVSQPTRSRAQHREFRPLVVAPHLRLALTHLVYNIVSAGIV